MEKGIDYAWLQISDLHIFDNTDWKIMQEAYEKLPYKDMVKFIVVTGDLHQYGDDYKKTIEFLNNILTFFGISKKNLFIVPGNHDSKECNDKELYTYYIEGNVDKEQECYKKYFVKGKLVDCFKEYNLFIKELYKDEPYKYEEPEQVCVINWEKKLNIIHINTAINCNGDNNLKQIVDIYKLSNLYETLDRRFPSIIIAHHDFDTLHKSHKESLTRFISDWQVSAYLCGDLHKEMLTQIHTYSDSGTNIPCIVCGKSAPQNKDSYSDLGCILYIKQKLDDRVDVIPFLWDHKKKTFQESPCFNNDKGKFYFKLLTSSAIKEKEMKLEKNNFLSKNESIWLPDAEIAKGKQTRFGTYTSTSIVNDFIQSNSNFWGLSAVKGIGKTFVLQVKRTTLPKDKMCLPIGLKPSVDNGWGTDTIVLGTDINLSALREFNNVISLWKYCIITYVINQLVNISQIKEKWWDINCPEKMLKQRLIEFKYKNQISTETFFFCTSDDFTRLDKIVKGVLLENNWTNFVNQDISIFALLQRRIEELLNLVNKKSVVILIDKVDQALRQISAEPPENCDDCHKRDVIKECKNENKSAEFCILDTTLCKSRCCYGCEKYESPYSNFGLRVYGEQNNKYKHVNLWQYLQIGLVNAISEIKNEFNGVIEIFFTIREEAFSLQPGLLGEHGKKITNLVQKLYYTKEEQRKIFYNCIKNQKEEYLYNSDILKQKGDIEEAFVGVGNLCHPYARNLSESIFDSIYRHSFDRTRDIQEYGEMLTDHLNEIHACNTNLERGEFVKELIEKKAAKLAFNDDASQANSNECYYMEKRKLLPNYWANVENFKKFILMFDRNLLFGKEVRQICKKYNELSKCCKNCNMCEAKNHPFSMLYKLGMLGQICLSDSRESDIEQNFLDSKDITYITGNELININEDIIYVLHPALTKSIEHYKHKIMHFKGFILGKGLKVSKDIIKKLTVDYNEMSKVEYEKNYFYKFGYKNNKK